MLKKTILAAATVAVSLVAFQPAAQAGNLQVEVHFGGGHGGHGHWGGGHGGHGGHGHWGGGHGGHGYHKLTCHRGKVKLRWNGYRHIRATDCRGRYYGFRAIRGHKIYKITMNAYTGRYNKRFIGFVR